MVCAAVAVDALLGELPRWHPLVGFGKCADQVERNLNRHPSDGYVSRRFIGVIALLLVVVPPVWTLAWLISIAPAWLAALIHVLSLYFALGARSLLEHVRPVGLALGSGDLARARVLAARIVTRDLSDANESELARAAVESVLENGNDAIFATLFWFVLTGAPGVIAYRLVNTLDAMWGYKTKRHLYFGWAGARLDDLMNYLPARLTALSYAMLGNMRAGLGCWRRQAAAWESPNAGPVMAAGAGALGLALGGPARYHGQLEMRPPLGAGSVPVAADVGRALRLVAATLLMWLGVLGLVAALYWYRVGHA